MNLTNEDREFLSSIRDRAARHVITFDVDGQFLSVALDDKEYTKLQAIRDRTGLRLWNILRGDPTPEPEVPALPL